MSTEYEAHLLKQDTGYDQRIIPFESFDSVKVVQDKGELQFVVAASHMDWSLLQKDARVVLWRKPVDGTKKIYHAMLLRHWEAFYDGKVEKYLLAGPDYYDILNRRIVAYDAGTAYCKKNTGADNMMKSFVRQNLGSNSVDTDRDLSDYGFSVEGNVGRGTVILKEASRRYILDILQEISLESRKTATTATYFSLDPVGRSGYDMIFRTKILQPGLDHRFPSGEDGPVWFAIERGNMENPRLILDSREEINYVYAAGIGVEEDRIVTTATDTTRIAHSVINRREGLFDGRNVETIEELADEGQELLAEGVPTTSFAFDVVQTDSSIYGVHWDIGDRVTASYKGVQYDMFVASVSISFKNKKETITVTLVEEL